ncbi:MAG: hypothetical protein ACI9D4_002413 [Polaribacter sp.]|jgi:hypothetical protein
MDPYLNHSILKEFNLIYTIVEGNYSLEDYMNLRKNIISDSNYNPSYNQIIDFSNSKYIGTREEINTYVEWGIQKNVFGKAKTSLLTDLPHQAVVTTLFLSHPLVNNLQTDIFTTLKGALNFVGINHSHLGLIKKEIKKLISKK